MLDDTCVMAVPPGAFGERLKALQREAGLTNEQLARRIGTGLRNVQRWRAAEVAPRLDALIELADALEVSLDDLVGREFDAANEPRGAQERRATHDDLAVAAREVADRVGPPPGDVEPASRTRRRRSA